MYLTKGYLKRKFCRLEIRWAQMYRKEIVLVWKQEGPGAVASFDDFFTEMNEKIGDDDGSGLADN